MPRQVERLVIMCIACLPLTAIAAEDTSPDIDFLEYLGLMVEDDGEYLDLMDFAALRDERASGAQPAAPVEPDRPVHDTEEAAR